MTEGETPAPPPPPAEPAFVVVYNPQGYQGVGDNVEEAKGFFRNNGGRLQAGYTAVFFPEGSIFQGFDDTGKIYWDGPRPTAKKVPAEKGWNA